MSSAYLFIGIPHGTGRAAEALDMTDLGLPIAASTASRVAVARRYVLEEFGEISKIHPRGTLVGLKETALL